MAETLTAMECASGLVMGSHPGSPLQLPRPDGRPARAVLEDVLLDSLRHEPCLVSFSGGRDSSAVLATAVHVARREGLPLPMPISLRFPGVASTEETEWQELVVGHLGVKDWVRIDVGSELDLLGDIACEVLRRHGLVWPANAYFHVPMFRAARGGVLLTGLDGDGLFGYWRWARPQAVLARRARARPKDVLRVGLALAPRPLRRLARSSFAVPPVSWLRPAAHRAFVTAWIGDAASEPRRWDQRVTWYGRRRYLHLAQQALGMLAADYGVEARHPLGDRLFLAALARDGGASGWGDRTEIMRALVGDLLPAALIERRRKAEFGRALWRERARAFARDWDGTGVDRDMVDADRLREAWAADNPWFASTTLLHAAWLVSSGASAAGSRTAVS